MRVEAFTYNAPTTEYKFSTEGRLIETVSTGKTGTVTIYILHADERNLLRNIKTLEVFEGQVQIDAEEDAVLYDEISAEEYIAQCEEINNKINEELYKEMNGLM